MSLTGLASRCGTTTDTIKRLLGGEVSVGVSSKLHTTTSSLQTFVNGGTSVGLASQLGITSSSLQELRSVLGKEGAAGFLLGLVAMKGVQEK